MPTSASCDTTHERLRELLVRTDSAEAVADEGRTPIQISAEEGSISSEEGCSANSR